MIDFSQLLETLVTNTPSSVRRFYHDCTGRVIVKAVAKGAVDPNNAHHFGNERFVYTSPLTPEDLDELDGVRVCAHLFQERVDKSIDLRVVVIGKQVLKPVLRNASKRCQMHANMVYFSYEVKPICKTTGH